MLERMWTSMPFPNDHPIFHLFSGIMCSGMSDVIKIIQMSLINHNSPQMYTDAHLTRRQVMGLSIMGVWLKAIYYQTQGWSNSNNGMKSVKCLLIPGMDCPVQVLALPWKLYQFNDHSFSLLETGFLRGLDWHSGHTWGRQFVSFPFEITSLCSSTI